MSTRTLKTLRAAFGNSGILGGSSSAKDFSYSDGYESVTSLTDEEGKKVKGGFGFSFRRQTSARESDDDGFLRHTDDDDSLTHNSSGYGSGRGTISRNGGGAPHRIKSLRQLGRDKSAKDFSTTPSPQTGNVGDSEDDAENADHTVSSVFPTQVHHTAYQHHKQIESNNNNKKKKRNSISMTLLRRKVKSHTVYGSTNNSEISESEDESHLKLPSPPQKTTKRGGFFHGGRRLGNRDAALAAAQQKANDKVRLATLVTQKYNASRKNMLSDLPRPNHGRGIPSLLPDMDDATVESEESPGPTTAGTSTFREEASDLDIADENRNPYPPATAARAAEAAASSPFAASVLRPLSVSQQENEQRDFTDTRTNKAERSHKIIARSPVPSGFHEDKPSYRREASILSVESLATAQTINSDVSLVSVATAKISNRTKDARLRTVHSPSPILESIGSADDAEGECSNDDTKNNNDCKHDHSHDSDGDHDQEDIFYTESNSELLAANKKAAARELVATQDGERRLNDKLSVFSLRQSSNRSGPTEHSIPQSFNPVNVKISKVFKQPLSSSSSSSPPPRISANSGSARVAASKSSTHPSTASKSRPSIMSAIQDGITDHHSNDGGKEHQTESNWTASRPGLASRQADRKSSTSGAEASRESPGLRKSLSRSQRFRQIRTTEFDNTDTGELEQHSKHPVKPEFDHLALEDRAVLQNLLPVDAARHGTNESIPENKSFLSDRAAFTPVSSSTLMRTTPGKSRSEKAFLVESTELHDFGPLKNVESNYYNDASLGREEHQFINSSSPVSSSSSKSPTHLSTLTVKAASEIFSKYDSVSSIKFGPLDKASFNQRPPSLRVRDGVFLTAQRLHRAQSSRYDDDDDDTSFGTLVMEGPSPDGYEAELDENGEERDWWTVQVPIFSKDLEESDARNYSPEFFRIASLEDVQNIHAIVADFLEAGRFSQALYVLTDVLLPALTSNRSADFNNAVVPTSFNGSSLVNMTIRNIGTIQLWQERYEDAMNTFWDAISNNSRFGRNQVSSSQAGENTQEAVIDVFDQAASLVLLGQCLYALGNFDEANRVFLKTLSIVRSKIKDYATGDELNCAKTDNSDHHFTAGKVLNNIGCGFCELGFYKSASRSFQRAVLVYISASDSILKCPKGQGSFATYSLAAMLNVLKCTPKIAEAVPLPFVLDAAVTFCNLAFVLVRRKKYHDAATSLMEALRLQKMIVDPHHSIVLSTLENLAFVYIRDRRPKKALRVYEHMLQMELETFSEPSHYHETMSKVLGNMNYVYIKMAKFQSAFWCLQGVLAHQESYLNDDDERLQETRMLLLDQGAQLADPYAQSNFRPS